MGLVAARPNSAVHRKSPGRRYIDGYDYRRNRRDRDHDCGFIDHHDRNHDDGSIDHHDRNHDDGSPSDNDRSAVYHRAKLHDLHDLLCTSHDDDRAPARPGRPSRDHLQGRVGAAPIQGQLVEHQIERLTVHHTAVVMGSNTRAPARIRSYQNYHQGSGWPDVAYHYLIDANGHIYEGRPVAARGDTFTEYDPTGHFLVCCDGHFDEQNIPAAQVASLANVLAWAAVRYEVGPATIAGHRDYASTTCPGSNLAALVGDRTLQSMVEQRIAAGVSSLGSLCGQAGRDRVAAIESGSL